MLDDISTFWMEWNEKYVDNFRFGLGDKIGEYNLVNYLTSAGDNITRAQGALEYLDYMMDIYRIDILNGYYTFYHDDCSMVLDFHGIASFSIGDILQIEWRNLSQATSLNTPIYIKSDDIIGINHTLYILESGCILCKDNDYSLCVDCSKGIQIMDLKTYNINENEYKIYIETEFENLRVTQNPTILHRNLTQIEFVVNIDSNDTNLTCITSGFYPDAELWIIPKIINNPTQRNGTITIEFDREFSFIDNYAKVFLDFENENKCQLIYNNNTKTDCYNEPLYIPTNMIFKPKLENRQNGYLINLKSNDIQITGNATFNLHRKIQNITINAHNSVPSGKRMNISYKINDAERYQDKSIIHIRQSYLDIDVQMTITYSCDDLSNSNCTKCELQTEEATISCDKGVYIEAKKKRISKMRVHSK